MKDHCAPFKGKKITLLGLGLLGRGAGDAEFLARCGADLTVTDKKSEVELTESVARLKKYPNVVFRLGGHSLDDFTGRDLVIKAAGVRLDSPEIAAARKAGVPVAMSTALFAQYAQDAGGSIVGVTGTRGKSTVSAMIHHALRTAGRRTLLGGNVRGASTLAMLPQVEAGDVCVLELDSWQLQGFGELGLSPRIAIFTNLMPDHQNYYADMDEYFADKANIFAHQHTGDTLVSGNAIASRIRLAHPPVEPLVPAAIPADWQLKVAGEHNRENASLAASALRSLGLSEAQIREGLESFEAVEGRLQFVREVRKVKIYNDNNATTPEATMRALEALDGGGKRIVLIAGGSDKGLDVGELALAVRRTCKAVFLLEGGGTKRLADALGEERTHASLADAFAAAMRAAEGGDTLLFSPAFASFGMFKNEYERNDEFLRLVAAAA